MRKYRHIAVGMIPVFWVAVASGTAVAQDYTVTTSSGELRSRPSSATQQPITSFALPDPSVQRAFVQLPFAFPYYGTTTDGVTVSCAGFLVTRTVTQLSNALQIGAAHGQDAGSGGFPYSESGFVGNGNGIVDGLIAPLWGDVRVNHGTSTGLVWTWVDGSAPDRVFVVSWENVRVNVTGAEPVTFQAHLHETSGRIVFAYGSTGTWFPTGTTGFVCGIDSLIDTRFTCPLGTAANTGNPAADFVFDPLVATITGTARLDRRESDAAGVAHASAEGVPAAGSGVELRRNSDGFVYAASRAGPDGSFSVRHVGAPGGTAATLAVAARNDAVTVGSAAGGSPASWILSQSLSLASDADTGVRTLGDADDESGDLRAALGVALDCAAARDAALAGTTDAIPRLDVVLDPASSAPTSYRAANGSTPALLTVASGGAPDPDAWDRAVVVRTYGRHVLASIAGPSPSAYDDRFDAVSDETNAFAEAFGWALWTVVSEDGSAVNATGPESATVLDLESPAFTAARGPSHAGAVSQALHDLVDGTEEAGDSFDGTGAAAVSVIAATDSAAVPVTASRFLASWIAAGFDAEAATRSMIASGALADDDAEPNDGPAEAAELGVPGVRRTGLVLQPHNEDWFAVTVGSAVPRLVAGATPDPLDAASLSLEIRSASDAVVASGAPVGGAGRVVAATGPIPAGTYRVRVRLTSGGTVSPWTVQVHYPLEIPAAAFTDWTLGRPYDRLLGVAGGVGPWTVQPANPAYPPGLYVTPAEARCLGTPTAEGTFRFTVTVSDAADPPNVVSRDVELTIHPPLDVALGRCIGFPVGRDASVRIPRTGGTDPVGFRIVGGALPEGLETDVPLLRIAGSTTLAGSAAIEWEAEDAAGSADAGAALVVGCLAAGAGAAECELAPDGSACGVWLDAVRGSSLRFGAVTAKKRSKRAISAVVTGPDGTELAGGKVRGRQGTATGSGFVCPESGRFFVVFSSDTGPETLLLATASAAAPAKSAKVRVPDFGAASVEDVAVGALPGARLVVRATGDRKSRIVPRCVALIAPDGTPAALGSAVKTTATGFLLTADLPVGGTWTVRIAGDPLAPGPGTLTWSWTARQPKGASWSAD